MPDTDAPAPFVEAYRRLTDAQADDSFETRQHRDAIRAASEQREKRNTITRRLPKPF